MRRILIVDDKEENRYLLKVLLEGYGFEVDEANHGAEALVKARQKSPQLAISDLLMPVMDGYMLLRHWKSDEQLKQIPFIVYTATYTEPKDEKLALSLGADAFIVKPTEPEPFMARIQEVLSKQSSGLLSPIKQPSGNDEEQFQVYSEVLIRKLEEKALQLEEANRALELDIEARIYAEKELQESEKRLQEAQRIAKMGDFTWDMETGEVTWSDGLHNLLGYDPSESINYAKVNASIIHPEDLARVNKWLEDATTSGKDELPPNEYRIIRKNGDVLTILTVGKIKQRTGKKPEIFATIQDITERKRYEVELERLTAAINQAGESVVITDPEGNIQYVNPAFEAVSGYSRQEVIGQNPRILKSGKQDSVFYENMWQTISSHKKWSGIIDNKRKDGSLYTETVTISPVLDGLGKIVNYVAVKRDITDHLQLEAKYQQSQKMEAIGLLAGGIAHDFNNMLTVIIGYTDLALASLSVDDPLHRNFIEIQAASQRSMNIIRQLLAFSRKQLIAPSLVRLNEHISDLLRMLGRLIGEDIELKFLPYEDLWNIWMDPSQISQILTNLAVNARDAISDTGKVSIETSNVLLDEAYQNLHKDIMPGEYILLAFSDTGKGISKEIADHIFEPFFTTKDPGKGTGLGLSTVYGIVKQNNGYIHVYSESGLGTTFKIYLPRYQGAVETVKEKSKRTVTKGTETILVVEDYEEILYLAVEILELQGYKMLHARNPEEAFMISEQYKDNIELLITDVVLPTMNGKDLEERIKKTRPDIKTLYMSGYSVDIITQRGVIEQGVSFLQKPFTIQSLASKVREVLDQ